MVMALAQDGGGFPFFSPCFFKYICGEDINEIAIDVGDVPDYDAYELLGKVRGA